MKIAIASDLHLEVRDVAFENPGSDVLVLAGDICTLRHMDADGILGDRFRAFFQNCTSRWEHVIYILGTLTGRYATASGSRSRAGSGP